MEVGNNENKFSNHKKIHLINDMIYKGERKLEVQVHYQDIEDSNVTSIETHNINLLLTKVVGTIVDDQNKIVTYNYETVESPEIISISEADLKNKSNKIYRHININSPSDVDKDVFKAYNINEKFIYSDAHKIAARNNPGIDFFLIPSHEVFRYFFLKGNRLSESLFFDILSPEERRERRNDELFLKPNKDNLIFKNDEEERIAFLAVSEKLSEVEIECIFRIAFIKNAFDCIEGFKDCVLNNSQNIKNHYRPIKTILSQDYPFEIMVSGNVFEFKGVKYFLVNEILDTLEYFPYDKIKYSPFTDRRENNLTSLNVKVKTIMTNATISYTAVGSNPYITSNKTGDKDGKALIEVPYPKGFSFQNKQEIKIEKVSKEDKDIKYIAPLIKKIIKDDLTIDGEIAVDGKSGRADIVVKKDKKNNQIEKESSKRREIFFGALDIINKNFELSYFKIEKFNSGFIEKHNVNYHKTIIDKENKSNEEFETYNTIICRVFSKSSERYHYIVRADIDGLDRSRYAIFNTPLFSEINPKKVYILHRDLFSKKGVSFKKDKLNGFSNIMEKESYKRFNQADQLVEELKLFILSKLKERDS